MEFGIGSILATVWTAIGVPAVVYGFRWLGSMINRNKAMEGSLIDDKIIQALRTGISNIGNKTADALRKSPNDWVESTKAALREAAKDEALLLLDDKSRQRFHDLGDAALDVMIRKIVDDRETVQQLL